MLRRLSILVRRPSQTRAEFARAWEDHGTLVKQLPGIRGYQQNHVVEECGHVGAQPRFRVDGIVELRFDSIEAMQAAFASDAAGPVKADEPHFLGHGTGYVAAADQPMRAAANGTKLIVACRGDGEMVAQTAARLPGLAHSVRDDVVSVIARPEMAEGPQEAALFLHLYFDDAAVAQGAAKAFRAVAPPSAAFSILRVRTLTIV